MVSRATLSVVLAAFVLLSGCSSFVGGGPATEELPEDPESFEYADGFAADGVSNGSAAVETYSDAVQAQSNYTADYDYLVETGEGETGVNVTYRTDTESQQAHQQAEIDSSSVNATVDTYYDGDTRYTLTEYEGQQSEVGVENRSYPADRLTAAEALQPLLLNATSYNATVDRRDGVPVVVYETSELGNASAALGVEGSDSVSSFEATFVVDSEGLVHSASYRLEYVVDGEERSASMEFDLTDIDSTTVERPDWADES